MTIDLSSTRLKRLMIAGGFLLVVACLITLFAVGRRDDSPEGYKRSVGVFEGRKRVDALCSSIPIPPDAELSARSVEGSSQTFAVSFHYTFKGSFKTIRTAYRTWLETNGWQYTDKHRGTFTKGGQHIVIELVPGRYVVGCSEPV